MSTEFLPRWTRANGLDFAYLEAGAGPLVLCLHGFPDTAWSFRPLLSVLAASGYRAVAPFMRGYAPTSLATDGDYRSTTLAHDALELIEALGARDAFMVGHDWGAVATYIAATRQPERVRGIVTAAVPHLRHFLTHPTPAQLYRSRYMAFFQLRGIAERRVAVDDFLWLRNLIHSWSPGWHCGEVEFAPLRAAFSDPLRITAALGYYRALPATLASREALSLLRKKLRVPARVICGIEDGCIGAGAFVGQESCFASDYELITMQGAGHFMHCEQPDIFARHVVDFLSRNT